MVKKKTNLRDKLIEHNLRLVAHIAKKYGDVIHNDFLCSVLQDSNFLIRYRRDYDTEQWYSLVDDLIGEIDEQIVKYFQI